jgi:2-polyprenyl-6-methoxyphenol hydroxylase-like FAD-dependent oxidoreductase
MNSKRYDIVIIGIGGGALILAYSLASKGYKVAVFEKGARPRIFHRGEIVQPASIEILARLNLLPDLMKEDIHRFHEVCFYKTTGQLLCTSNYHALPAPHPYGLVLAPEALIKVLLRGAAAKGVDICWGTEFQSVLREGQKVVGVNVSFEGNAITVQASIVVGADGWRSPVREALGIAARIHPYSGGFLTMGLPHPPAFGSRLRYYVGKGINLGLFPVSTSLLYLLYMVPVGKIQQLFDAGVDAFKERILSFNPELADSMKDALSSLNAWDQTAFARCCKVTCSSWVVDGGALIGESAHAMNAHTANGRNAAIQDAMVLSDVLDECFKKGDFTRRLLFDYEAARRPDVTVLQRMGDEMAWVWETGFPPMVFLRDKIFRSLGRRPELMGKFVSTVSGVKVQPFTLSDRAATLFYGLFSR